jgi:hypothetical protein
MWSPAATGWSKGKSLKDEKILFSGQSRLIVHGAAAELSHQTVG